MLGTVALWLGFAVAMAAGSVAHELTHYTVARLAGAENVRLRWPLRGRPHVYYEVGGRQCLGSTIRIVNLAPVIVAVGWVGTYLTLNGLPALTPATALVVAFLFGYVAFGGIEDYRHDRALRHPHE